jgi:hypothetical protein
MTTYVLIIQLQLDVSHILSNMIEYFLSDISNLHLNGLTWWHQGKESIAYLHTMINICNSYILQCRHHAFPNFTDVSVKVRDE